MKQAATNTFTDPRGRYPRPEFEIQPQKLPS